MKTKTKLLVSILGAIITGITLLSIFLVGSVLIDLLPKQIAFALAVLFLMAALAYTFYREISKPQPTEETEYLDEDEIPMRARKISDISSWEAWNSSSLYSYFDKLNPRDIVCIDSEGYKCLDRKDFEIARDNNRFPVTVYRHLRITDVEPENK